MTKLRKLLAAVFVSGALVVGAAGCGSSATTTSTPSVTAAPVTTSTPATTQTDNPQGNCPDGEQYDAATGNCYPDGQTIPE